MNWLVGLGILLVAALLLWAFSALFVSMLAGLAVSALLWLPLRWWRRRQLLRELEQNPALDIQQQAHRHPALFRLLSAAAVLSGCLVMLVTLVQLPEDLYSPQILPLGSGLAFVVAASTLIRLMGHLVSEGEDAAAGWSLAAGIVPMLSLVALMFVAPNTAGWMAWRDQWRGYASTQLRVPLKADDAEHRQALLQLVQPLLQQGSRIISHRERSRNGSSYTLRSAVPAFYRFHEGALELQLAGLMPDQQLQRHQTVLNLVANGDVPSASLLAYAQCQPSLEKMARSRLLSQGRDLMQQMRTCLRSKEASLRSTMQLLQGQLEPAQVQATWFNPKRSNWLQWAGWKAAELPQNEELQELDMLR